MNTSYVKIPGLGFLKRKTPRGLNASQRSSLYNIKDTRVATTQIQEMLTSCHVDFRDLIKKPTRKGVILKNGK